MNINIDKTDYYLGDDDVIIKNLNAGLYSTNYYEDMTVTSLVTVEGYISALEGDRLQACVMEMTYNTIACDYQYANSPGQYANFLSTRIKHNNNLTLPKRITPLFIFVLYADNR